MAIQDDLAALREIIDHRGVSCDPDLVRECGAALDRITAILNGDPYRPLLEIGFDSGVSASVAQFQTINKFGGCTVWEPPENPFRA